MEAADVAYPPVFHRKLEDDLTAVFINIECTQASANDIRLEIAYLPFAQQQLFPFDCLRFEEAIEYHHVFGREDTTTIDVVIDGGKHTLEPYAFQPEAGCFI